MQILKCTDLINRPWKNGGGVTRPIAEGLLGNRVIWTISRADVAQDGPFSDFTGMSRVLTVVSGGPMILENPAADLRADLGVPVRFDGALQIQSRLLDGPLTDLNLMFDPTQCGGDVIAHHGPAEQTLTRPANGLLACHILSGAPLINAKRFDQGDTVFCSQADAEVVLGQADALLEIRLTYLDQSDAIRLCIAAR